MQYNIRWLSYSEISLIKALAEEIYENGLETYGPNLHPKNTLYDLFLVPEEITGSNYRKVVGIFDDNQNLMFAMGVRQLYDIPAWNLGWVISKYKNLKFIAGFKATLTFVCEYFENIGCTEFYVVHPASKEKVYQYILKYMREKYWTFVQCSIPKHTKSQYSFYWAIMGYQLYQYDIMIRRYILKRPQND